VAEVFFNKVVLVGLVLLLQIEFFYFLCYQSVIMLNKVLKVTKTIEIQPLLFKQTPNTPYLVIFMLSLFFFKSTTSNIIAIMLLVTIFFYKLSIYLNKVSTVVISNNILYLILPTFISFLFLLFFVKSFLLLFFFIEVYGVLYYFCFLTSYSFTSQTILKYKNGLLLLLWNNFLTTFFLSIGCFGLMRFSGSTQFKELIFLDLNVIAVYFFLLGLF
jgi:hypothetical protein